MDPEEDNNEVWSETLDNNDDDKNVEIIELENLNPGGDDAFESQREKDLEDTSFTENIHSTLYDRVLETDGSEDLFVRTQSDVKGRLEDLRINKNSSTSTFDPNDIPNPKRDAGVIRRTIIYDKKQFINQVFGIKVNKKGPYSQILYNELKTTVGEKSGKINGATYKGKKILILMKGGRMEYSKSKSNEKLILDFKNTLNNAFAEHNVTPASIVEDHIPHEIREETVDNIVENAGDDMDLKSFVILQNVEKNPLTSQEVRELIGVLTIDWTDLKKRGGKKIVEHKLEALRIEKENLKRKAFEAKVQKKDVNEHVYNEMVRATELKIDSGRMMINEKPEGNLAVEILKREADANEMSKFDKFKKWSKENLLGLSAIAITIAGIIVTIVSATRTVVRVGASALSKFAKAVASIAQKFGPVIAAVGSVLANILLAGTKGLLWLAKNLWLLAIALAYFVYSEYKSRKKKNP